MIESEQIATIRLNKIFRQAAKSKIIVNAHRVNEGKGFISKGSKEAENTDDDFFFINELSQEKMIYNVVSLAKDRLAKYGDYNFLMICKCSVRQKKVLLEPKS